MVEDFGDFEPEYIRLTEDKREIYDFRFFNGHGACVMRTFWLRSELDGIGREQWLYIVFLTKKKEGYWLLDNDQRLNDEIMNGFGQCLEPPDVEKVLKKISSLPDYEADKKGGKPLDISMSRIRRDIDRACEAGRQYTIIPRTGDNHVDAAICTTMEAEGYKVARNQNKILISWY